MIVVKILIFLLIFFVVVVSHEFGHFIIAKANGIRVVEFSVGMGPRIFKFKKKETIYSLRLLPIGGACIFDEIEGMETSGRRKPIESSDEVEEADVAQLEEEITEDGKKKGCFTDAPLFARFTTTLAGPVFNFILAWFLAIFIVIISGSVNTEITAVIEGYPAEEAGMLPGDEIISINNERVFIYDEVSLISQMNQGEPLSVVVDRGGERITFDITPKYDEEDERYYIGFQGGRYRERNAWTIISGAYFEVRYWIKTTLKSLFWLITGRASVNDMAGPVGVATVVSDVYDTASAFGFLAVLASMLNIAVLLSANLGVINLLPLPAIDGGKIFFMLIELVRGKPIPKDKEAIVHFIGFVLLMVLMGFVFYNDIARLFQR